MSEYVTKKEFDQMVRDMRARWAAEEQELHDRLKRNLKLNPPKPREPVEMPQMDVQFDDDDELDIEDPSYADALFNAGINKYSINMKLEEREEE